MYKNSSDQINFIGRTGSHATKESATGRIDAIPSWAQEPEAYYNSVRDRWKSILDQLIGAQESLAGINEKLKQRLPFNEYEHLRQHRDRLSAKVGHLEQQQSEYRPLARAACERAWATVFYCVAEKLLSRDDLIALKKETDALLGHRQQQIRKGDGEKSDEQIASIRARKQRQRRFARWEKHKTGTITVWADNKPVQQKYADKIRQNDKSQKGKI